MSRDWLTKDERDAFEMQRHSDTRNRIIEECARLMETRKQHHWMPQEAAAAIRALKDKP